MAKQPSERFATAADVAAALRAMDATRRPRRFWLVLAAAVVALGSTAATATWWLQSPSDPKAVRLPLHTTLEVLVWDAERPQRQGVSAVAPESLPLRDGDRLRVSAQLNQPAYVYLLWLDARGSVLPVYPWRRGQWERRPDDEQPRMYLALPDRQDNGWLLQVERDGLESLLLLARRSPLPENVDLRKLLAKVPHALSAKTSVAMSFQDGHPLPEPRQQGAAPQRPPDLQKTVQIPDPLLQTHRRTAETLRPYFELIRAVSFPVTGG